LRLVSLGVPYEVALQLTPAQRLGYTVILGELQGGHFDWDEIRWKKK